MNTAQAQHRIGIVPRGWQVAAFVFGLLVLIQCGLYAYIATGRVEMGSAGVSSLYQCDRDHFCAIDRIRPGYPAARAGIVMGDQARLDRFWEGVRNRSPGDRVGLTVRHQGSERHLTLAAESYTLYAPTYIIAGVTNALVALIALLIIARAGRRRSSLLLALALLCAVIPGNYPRLWQNAPALFPVFLIGLTLLMTAAPVLMLASLRDFREEVIGRPQARWLNRLIWGVAIGETVFTIFGLYITLDATKLLFVRDGLSLISLAWAAGSVIAPIALAAGWRDVPTISRTRYAFMWAAVGVLSLNAAIDPVIMLTGNNYVDASWPVVLQLASIILGALLFAYAILRHRVIDLGFAINRTLIYSTLSFLTLLAFGLVEWGSEKLLPERSHEASAIVDAGIALALFMVFHRIHDAVEHGVERLFFHKWRVNEETLNRFVGQASYITKSDVLIERTVGELSRFAGGAEVALYRAMPEGFRRGAGGFGGAPALLDRDEPALVALRAERHVLHDAFVPGGMVVPMVHRAEVSGFVALGPKPNGEPYRPDEEQHLERATHQVGLDLHALRVEELEQANAALTARLGLVASPA